MKKRILSLALAAALALSLGITALADNLDTYSGDSLAKASTSTSYTLNNSATQFDVTDSEAITNYEDYRTAVYAVEVSWTVTGGSYSRTDAYKWNPETLKYDAADPTVGTPTVGTGTAEITVTNKSNDAVSYTIAYMSNSVSGTDVSSETSANDKTGTLATADVNEDGSTPASHTVAGKATSATYNGTISYTDAYKTALESVDASTNTKMGTYTVTIGKPYSVGCMTFGGLTYDGPTAVAKDADFTGTYTLDSSLAYYFAGSETHNEAHTVYTPHVYISGSDTELTADVDYTWTVSNGDKTGMLTIDAAKITGNISITFSSESVAAASASAAATVEVYSGESSFVSIVSNNLTINTGETWADVITNNSGKTITFTVSGTEYTGTLAGQYGDWFDLGEATVVVLLVDGEYQGHTFINNSESLFKTSDTVPETIYLVAIH